MEQPVGIGCQVIVMGYHDQRLLLFPHDPPHLLRAVCHKGIAKRPPDPKEIHMALVMRPLHTRDEGDPRKMWQAQVLRIIVVIGHGDKIEALMFGYFSERCNIVLPIGSV